MSGRATQAAEQLVQLAGSTPEEYAAGIEEYSAKDILGAIAWFGGPVAVKHRADLTVRQLRSLDTDPVEIAAAPGAGFANVMVSYAFDLRAGDPYDGYVGIRYLDGSSDLSDFRPQMAATEDMFTTGYLSGVDLPLAEIANRPIVLVATEPLGQTGTGTLRVGILTVTIDVT